MGKKKKRARRLTVYGYVEGEREQHFLDYLREVYKPDENNIAFYPEPSKGGTSDRIVTLTIQKCDRDKSFAWFDEDFEPTYPLSKEVRESLAKCWNIPADQTDEFYKCPLKNLQANFNPNNRKPVLIVSQPVCVESFILQILSKPLLYQSYEHTKRDTQIRKLKDKIKDIFAGGDEIAFYRQNLCYEKLENLRKNLLELDLLIKMLT